jgi:hypothetical protein
MADETTIGIERYDTKPFNGQGLFLLSFQVLPTEGYQTYSTADDSVVDDGVLELESSINSSLKNLTATVFSATRFDTQDTSGGQQLLCVCLFDSGWTRAAPRSLFRFSC